ncbi:hypothetical protein LOTGIDRAFT_128067 [Lottia gigantea]|uniref:Nbr1 FW domain-containing protein n=1 Tax=Lottia gigantea TaxID=225164 RepID=V3Z7Y8_LOTGI|nr:hypothetical protein LOTGIDRAFT_128067 [Lottia gigantea]ESO86948.1 hypothetical protein LOTGIDRAFT_128067 [Lottia gigantea]
MDVDNELNDLDGKLLQQFSSMGTTDRDVLIAEFQKLLGNQLNPSSCAFFLDMNNWNLQAAIGSYYDFEQPSVTLPAMAFVKDITIGEGEAIPPNTPFVKTWRIKNGGNESWPPGCSLRFCGGDNMSRTDRVMVDRLSPNEESNVSIEMVSPGKSGVYQGQWRMNTSTGTLFGEVIQVVINVEDGGLLAVTQQMSRVGEDFVEMTTPLDPSNPFATPEKSPVDGVNTVSPIISQTELSSSPPVSNDAARWLIFAVSFSF